MVKNTTKEVAIDPDDHSKGKIQYRMEAPDTPAGVFVTTYYFRETDCADCKDFKGQDAPWTKTDIYKTGLLEYCRLTERPEFAGWKVVILTDQISLEKPVFRNATDPARLKKHWDEWRAISTHPNVIFGVVHWPEYAVGGAGDGKTIDNAILRALRMKAFQDFSSGPVFVRDADTLFENILKRRLITDELARWEATLLAELRGRFNGPDGYQLLVASQPNYQRQWHMHPETGVKTTGCYAAITSSIGPIPEFVDTSLWRQCLAYLRAHSRVMQEGTNRVPNNLGKPTYIGKDEQLLSYVILPAIFKKIYFYYFEYIQVEGGKVVETESTPFAGLLIQKGFVRYPSPYMEVRGEAPLPLEESIGKKRKDENEVTEGTHLNTKLIPLAMQPQCHQVLQLVFGYFLKAIKDKATEPGFVPKQLGGRRTRRFRHRREQGRKRQRRSRNQSRQSGTQSQRSKTLSKRSGTRFTFR